MGLNQAILRLQDEFETVKSALKQCSICSASYEIEKQDTNNCLLWVEGQADPWEGRLGLDAKRDGRQVILFEAPVNTGRPIHKLVTNKITKIVAKPYQSSPPV